MRLLQAVTVATNQASSFEEAAQVCIDRVCAHMGWSAGHAYFVATEDDAPRLLPTDLWHLEDPEKFESLWRTTEAMSLARGIGLPGRVLAWGKPAWITDVVGDPNFLMAQSAKKAGIESAVAFPVVVGREVAAVLEFFSQRPAESDETL